MIERWMIWPVVIIFLSLVLCGWIYRMDRKVGK